MKNWNYLKLTERINDGYTLRRFTRFHSKRVPKHDAFTRAFNRLAREVLQKTERIRRIDLMTENAIGAVRKQIEHYYSLGDRVVDQARRRVINKKQVLNEEKIFSIFKTHTDLIKRGKILKPVEFGHKVY